MYDLPGAPASLVVFSFPVPIETEGAPSFAESAVLILRSEQRVGGEDVGSSGPSAAIMIDNGHAETEITEKKKGEVRSA
jgi:hypothetical protein